MNRLSVCEHFVELGLKGFKAPEFTKKPALVKMFDY